MNGEIELSKKKKIPYKNKYVKKYLLEVEIFNEDAKIGFTR